jgi:predicted nucleotidyltransferase
MKTDQEILNEIKSTVQEIVPDAKVFLFGSRATGKSHEESDWDILILTKNKYPRSMKWIIFDKLLPLGNSISSMISVIMEQEDEWFNNAGYYALRLNVEPEKIAI